MGNIDKDAASTSNNSDTYSMMDSSGDSQTSSSTYPFYVNLDSSDGLMLGQHVYIEPDEGQDEQKAGLWLSEVYIVDADTDSPYVWARNDKKKLEKRSVILGQYDENMGEYEIADGLSKSDYIAYPSDSLKEGMSTTTNSDEATDPETLDMEPIDNSSSDMSSDGTDDDMAAYQDNIDETYENDSDGTVIDDPENWDDISTEGDISEEDTSEEDISDESSEEEMNSDDSENVISSGGDLVPATDMEDNE